MKNRIFIFSEDLLIAVCRKFLADVANSVSDNINSEQGVLCSYQKNEIKTDFVEIYPGRRLLVKPQQAEKCSLFFLLHTSDEKHFDYKSYSHFQIEDNMMNDFWVNSQGRTKDINTQVVFFKHELISCTAYGHFFRILKDSNKIEDFVLRLQELFDFHSSEKRRTMRKKFLSGLGYEGEASSVQEARKNVISDSDIKSFYV